jgi:hypothetical protein
MESKALALETRQKMMSKAEILDSKYIIYDSVLNQTNHKNWKI